MVWDSCCWPVTWQTGCPRFGLMDKQNLGLAFDNCDYHWSAQISSIYRKTAAKAGNWYQRWLWSSVWNIPTRKPRLSFQMVRRSRKFSTERPEKFCSIVPSNQIFLETFANGKKPLSPVMLADGIYWSVDKIWHRPIYFHLCDLFHSQD